MRLKGKVAVVTGAGQGIGEAIATRFAGEGCAVVVNDFNPDTAAKVVAAIEADGGRAVACVGDVTSFADNQRMVATARSAFGRLDTFVANAGIAHRRKPSIEVTEEEFDRLFAVNVKGIFQAARACLPGWFEEEAGNMIVVASTAGIRPRPGLCWYNATKGAAITATKAMAAEHGPKGVRFNAICPVATETPMLPTFMDGDNPTNRAAFVASVPLGRFGQPMDHANAALFLASDDAAFVTGVALEIDGGRCV